MAYNPNFHAPTQHFPPDPSLLRPFNPPNTQPMSNQQGGPGPDRFAPRRGGYRVKEEPQDRRAAREEPYDYRFGSKEGPQGRGDVRHGRDEGRDYARDGRNYDSREPARNFERDQPNFQGQNSYGANSGDRSGPSNQYQQSNFDTRDSRYPVQNQPEYGAPRDAFREQGAYGQGSPYGFATPGQGTSNYSRPDDVRPFQQGSPPPGSGYSSKRLTPSCYRRKSASVRLNENTSRYVACDMRHLRTCMAASERVLGNSKAC